ncbi:AI-2E family transporter [Microvirga sp. 2MCAF38]|uniref:AI-2E family transporter n=1 Tax=Microvirga sp. 2MCAF38 TaxID=3232989 RepID=UPI003F958A08
MAARDPDFDPSLRQNRIPSPQVPGVSGLVTLIVTAGVLVALYVGREVFLPITLAILLAFVIAPFADILRRLGLGRVPSVLIVVVLALGILFSLGSMIGYQVAGLAKEFPTYQATVKDKLSGLREGMIGRLPGLVRSIGQELNKATKEETPLATPPSSVAPPEQKPLPVEVHQPEQTSLELVQDILVPALKPFATIGIVFVVLIFILLQREDLRDRMIRLFGATDLHRTTVAMDDGARRLSRFFLTQLALNASYGVFIALGLWAIGVPSPILWGIFAALMRFVPYIGSVIAAILPALLAAAVDSGWTMTIMTLALFLISEPIMGQIVEPLVYGQSTGLSPFAVVVAAIFWTWLWGPVGLLIATPLTLCLVVLGRHVERLEFLDVLLGDRPALSPAENLYQRMLAGDPDEALESAEALLKERPLSDYYDEVALGALQMAANDAARDVLTELQMERITNVVQTLIHDLDAHADTEPKPDHKGTASDVIALEAGPIHGTWKTSGAVMCIAGRGLFDEAAAAMLAQLLEKHGLGSQVVPAEAVSRIAIADLDTEGVKMVCVSSLEFGGTPARLRYLVRRLKVRMPDVPVIVGIWRADAMPTETDALCTTLGVDGCVVTLHDGVARCLERANEDADDRSQMARPAANTGTGVESPMPVRKDQAVGASKNFSA